MNAIFLFRKSSLASADDDDGGLDLLILLLLSLLTTFEADSVHEEVDEVDADDDADEALEPTVCVGVDRFELIELAKKAETELLWLPLLFLFVVVVAIFF